MEVVRHGRGHRFEPGCGLISVKSSILLASASPRELLATQLGREKT